MQELRAALRAGHGYPGDAEKLDAELAEQLLPSVRVDQVTEVHDPGNIVDLPTVKDILAAYRSRVHLAAGPEAAAAVDQVVTDLLARQDAE
ncbi:hypothetical protein ACIQF6_28590 [Kitasatospora sp. NPDC092948]|uniref:hypothetical protein n=1 Tax=Kitasatospora sp. NPDC092948 TaxID=3364088 RepID=UPI00381277CF